MTDKPARKWNPAWKDTTRAERQAKRLAALNEIAIATGYESWRKLETAALNNQIVIRRNIVEIKSWKTAIRMLMANSQPDKFIDDGRNAKYDAALEYILDKLDYPESRAEFVQWWVEEGVWDESVTLAATRKELRERLAEIDEEERIARELR